MDGITLGIIAGTVFGLFSAVIMLPMNFDSHRVKYESIISAFIDRFMIGLIIPNINLGLDPVLNGLIIGIGLSLPSAIITRAYGPILIIGALGGLVIGYITKMIVFA